MTANLIEDCEKLLQLGLPHIFGDISNVTDIGEIGEYLKLGFS